MIGAARVLSAPVARRTVHELLAQARSRLSRLDPDQARQAVEQGALLVDIRSELHREHHGVIPGALFHPRSVIEWRADPASGFSDPRLAGDLDRHVIVVCKEGYQSSLVAATLQDLGYRRATDLAGGFDAWKAAGLDVALGDLEPVPETTEPQ